MDVSVVIAYRDLGCPHRQASFEYTSAWYERHGFDVVVEPGDETFTRASGINAGVRKARGDIIIQSDPDSLVPLASLTAAVALAKEPGLVVPHNVWLYLQPEPTARILSGEPIERFGPEDCDETGRNANGNVVVFSRETWERAGGHDERFGIWGGDDGAFAYAAGAFTQDTRRVPGPTWHLWHPRLPQSVPGSEGFVEQFAILAEYRDAARLGSQAVRDLVRSR